MKAVILAAGDGERLAPITQTLPKALLPIGSETILSRQIRQLAHVGVTEVTVVIGYEGQAIRDHLAASNPRVLVNIVENASYKTTSTAYSTWLASKFVQNDSFFLLDGDVVAEDAVFDALIGLTENTLLFEAKSISSPEEMKVTEENGEIFLSKTIPSDRSRGEFIGVAYVTADANAPFFAALELHKDGYYEEAFNDLAASHGFTLQAVEENTWIEIDFVTDYLQAVRLFTEKREEVPAPQVSEQVLLCPGPVMVSKKVKSALLHADIGHRETEFIEILTRCRAKLNKVYGATHDYTNVILTGSGTAANEALLSSYGPGKKLLILSNGEFGNRLIDLARCHDLNFTALEFGWTHPMNLEKIEETVANGSFDALMMVHHETSTGMLNPINEIGALLKPYNVDFLVDAVSSIGAEALNVEKANITFCTASANKALASLPGLAFVCGKRNAFQALKGQQAHTRYLDLYRHYEFEDLHYQTPNTPAVSLFYALETALDELLQDTLEKRMQHYGYLTSLIRNRLKKLGMSFPIEESQMSRVLTTVYYPDGIDVEAFHEWVKQHNYVIYRGKGPLLGRAFQIANIGHVREEHVLAFLDLMERGFQIKQEDAAVEVAATR
ncbi:aminotransferase class V-fold PLP-dependent enzyme [Tumebacillus sp. ITR2]|uniref:Aminotransferase class V-fold PLP-dependent enzyme n=1 Tax=Tumebacillus amylolyticus TaxID=2801339 RepID=A0ABS1J8H7_9BACL|nr:aminotransferase class V-fold PLP-dependent enzyme [Tumebacillus amylolyticus]MBL0386581.1 aminotransferase class V-fold PLP-dependent enzyme [Tumebacillus amylolyticus]